MENSKKQWNTALYVRLSKDDGDKEESNSISNQKDLIRDFVKSDSSIQICSEYVDDGFSGVDFNRPAFESMISDIKSGNIDCVIVKDLSRFGRNWIETGKYIDKIFPFMGVRFIAINDSIDTINARTTSDNLVIPFKNLVNDAYLRDISVKVRSQLEVKRKNGDFIGSFCVYGYKKDKENHNKLIVDEGSAKIVKDIFKWKIEGFSQQAIAHMLNEQGIPSPMEYKKENGMLYKTTFKTKSKALWSGVAIKRILANEIYTGVLEQGKRTTPNYKVTKRIEKSKNEWIRVENSHEPIISQTTFNLANDLLKKDLRKSPTEKSLFIFSGMLFCADCKQSMVRKTVLSKGKKYYYYVCSSSKKGKVCTSHSIKEENLENAVLYALQSHVKNIISKEKLLTAIEKLPYKQLDTEKIQKRLIKKQLELESCNQKRLNLYEDFNDKTITKDEYIIYKQSYDKGFTEINNDILEFQNELNNILNSQTNKSDWLAKYKSYANVEYLTRKTVVNLINKIIVHENKRIDILFRYQYDFEKAMEYAKLVNMSDDTQENKFFEGVCMNG